MKRIALILLLSALHSNAQVSQPLIGEVGNGFYRHLKTGY
jgi:hypothetical protein